MIDQRRYIAHQNIGGIFVRILRCVAVTVNPEIEHDDLIPLFRDRFMVVPLDPVHLRAGKQAVQQDEGPAITMTMHGKPRAVETFEIFGIHSGTAPVASIHRWLSAACSLRGICLSPDVSIQAS